MPLNKTEILSRRPAAEPIEIPEWGGTFYVRAMSGVERASFFDALSEGIDPNRDAKLIVRCLCDDAGQRVFTDADAEALGQTEGAVLSRVSNRLSAVNRLRKQDVDELEKN